MLTADLPVGHFGPPSSKGSCGLRLDHVVMHSHEGDGGERYQRIEDMMGDLPSWNREMSDRPCHDNGKDWDGSSESAPA